MDSENLDITENEFARLLSKRYGDGYVYITSDSDLGLIIKAVEKGLVTGQRYITRKGRMLLAKYNFYNYSS